MNPFRPLKFVSDFVDETIALYVNDGQIPLSRIETFKLKTLLTVVIIVHQFNTTLISRACFGYFSEFALRWFVHHSTVAWRALYRASVKIILKKYDITNARLVADDTERTRASSTKKIVGVHKIFNKKRTSYEIAQEFVVCILVTDSITVIVDIIPYIPDPEIKKWKKREAERKKLNKSLPIGEKLKPEPEPKRDRAYPTKERIALSSMLRFKMYFPNINVKSILFDAAYNTPFLVSMCRRRFPTTQIISRLASNQLVSNRSGRHISVTEYFSSVAIREYTVKVRGFKDVQVEIKSARIHVQSLNRWEHVVAIRYKGQANFRYHSGTDMSWRGQDIVFELGFRWLIEVVHEDWKLYEGYGRSATHREKTGLECGLGLSSMVDTCLLSHPQQVRLAQSGQPLRTVGTVSRAAEMEFLVQTIDDILEASNPKAKLSELTELLESVYIARKSRKHLCGVDLQDAIRGPPQRYV